MSTLPIVTSVTHPDKTRCEVLLRIPTDLEYFAGHFPSGPILPGFVQLAWVEHFAQKELGSDIKINGVKSVKFKRPILPEMNVKMSLQRKLNNLTFELSDESGICASGSLLTQPSGLP